MRNQSAPKLIDPIKGENLIAGDTLKKNLRYSPLPEGHDISTITKILKSADFQLIAIDGVDGSGKSTLARILSEDLGHLHINLDDYLSKNQKTYVDHKNIISSKIK